VGSRLKSRIERLEQRNGSLSHPSHGCGTTAEEIDREFEELPVEIARRAARIRERRERGEPEDPLPLSGRSGADLVALCVSYGRPERVPSEVREAVAESDRRALAGLPEEAVRRMEDLWKAVVAQAFECARSTLQAKES